MEDQLTVRLPRELTKALKDTAARMQRRPSEVVRMAVKEFLESPLRPGQRKSRRVEELIGSVDTGIPDLATRHREYVLRRLRNGG